MLGNLNNDQVKNLLASQVLGRLACTDGKQPYIVPVTYFYDGKSIYGQTNEGMKLNIMRENPNVCFEVDSMTDMNNWKSALVFGTFEELDGEKSNMARELLFGRVLSLMTSSTVHAHEHDSGSAIDDSSRVKYYMYKINIEKMSGRFETK